MTETSASASFEQLLDSAPLTKTQWQLWILSAMGVFLDGFDLFIIGVALPLIERDFATTPLMTGLIAGSAVVGAFVGAALGGWVTDKLGRKGMFVIDLIFFVVFAAASACAWNPISLIVFRFLLGVGVGADYPIGVSYIAENVPTAIRGRLVVGAFSFQALGSLTGVIVGLILLALYPQLDAWRWMLAFGVIPAVVVVLLRENLPESPRWYLSRGDYQSASEAATKLLERPVTLTPENAPQAETVESIASLFKPQHIRSTVLTSVPWFLQDIATYGIGIFTPTILTVLIQPVSEDFIAKDMAATSGAIVINIPLILGFLLCAWLVDRVGRIRLQIFGFLGMAVGLAIVGSTTLLPEGRETVPLIFAGFMLFNLLMNLGPNSTTYLLSGEVFPTPIRATGAGFAAAVAKLGAVVGTFFFPTLQARVGIPLLLAGVGAGCVLAAIVTLLFQVNTTGIDLEKISDTERL